MTDIEKLWDGVEAVARFHERRSGYRSPFHLDACGGCGCPAFQQPCSLCRYYPMGADKGYYSPKVATKEMFCTMVERSGPGGRDGTIATWHAVANMRKHENKDDVAAAAAEVEVPSAADYWDAIVVDGLGFSRQRSERFVNLAWYAIGDIRQLATGEFTGDPAYSKVPVVVAQIDDWVVALHSGDRDAMRESLEKLKDTAHKMRGEYPRNGNLSSSIERLSTALDLMDEEPFNAMKA
jgi:hypothetical protein